MLEPIEGQPGLFKNTTTGEIVNVRDYYESDLYDTIAIPGDDLDIAAGTEFIFFQDIQAKREVDTNVKTPRKLSAGQSMVLDRIGLYVPLSTGKTFPRPQHLKSIIDNSFFRLKINDLLQAEGPAIKFPSGYGWYGQTTEDDQGIVSIGVPATASASRLVKKQLLNQNHELDGVLRFDARNWLTVAGPTGVAPFSKSSDTRPAVNLPMSPSTDHGAVIVKCFLHGLFKAASTK
jgi:hypothetical protein